MESPTPSPLHYTVSIRSHLQKCRNVTFILLQNFRTSERTLRASGRGPSPTGRPHSTASQPDSLSQALDQGPRFQLQLDWSLENRVALGVWSHFINWKDEKLVGRARAAKNTQKRLNRLWVPRPNSTSDLNLQTHNSSFWLVIATQSANGCIHSVFTPKKNHRTTFRKIH